MYVHPGFRFLKKTDNYELRRILMDELVFSGEADDACVFTNIWVVAIKDYANENEL
jgi:hypothetical protein